jgi:signal transduction histidine kinase
VDSAPGYQTVDDPIAEIHRVSPGTGREVTGRRRDGTTFPIEAVFSEMSIAGRQMYTGVLRDVSERKRVDRLKSEFITTVNHELRTPLTSIRGARSPRRRGRRSARTAGERDGCHRAAQQ